MLSLARCANADSPAVRDAHAPDVCSYLNAKKLKKKGKGKAQAAAADDDMVRADTGNPNKLMSRDPCVPSALVAEM